MAKNYSEIYKSVYTDGNSMSFGNAMLRGNGVPLDITEVYNSYVDAVKYAATDPVAYEGQLLSVTENGDTTVYVITPAQQGVYEDMSAGTGVADEIAIYIKEVGSSPVGDTKSIVVAEDGTISLKGVPGLDFIQRDESGNIVEDSEGNPVKLTFQPLMTESGLTWVVPSVTTVEGLDLRLTSAELKIENLATTVGAPAKEDGTPATGLVKAIQDVQATANSNTTEIDKVNNKAVKNAEDIAQEIADRKAAISTLDSTLKEYVGTKIGEQAHFNAQVVTSTEAMTSNTTLYLIKANESDDAYEEYLLINDVPTKIGTTTTDLSDYSTTEEVASAIESAINTLSSSLTERVDDINTDVGKNTTDIANLKIADADLADRIQALEEVGSEKNYISSVSDEFTVTDGQLIIKSIASSKISGVDTAIAALQETVADKVDKVEGWTLLSPDDQAKLAALTLNGDEIQSSATVEAGSVKGLGTWITGQRDSIPGLLSSADATKLAGISAQAQVNVIEKIKIDNTELEVNADKSVIIPYATNDTLGVVLGSTAENHVSITVNGTMEVNSLNVNKLTQTEGDTLILNGGNALT